MLPRSFILLLCLLLSAAGVAAGYQSFDNATEFLSTGSVSLMVHYHTEAGQLARASFAIASGILGLSIPVGALLAGRFRKRGHYLNPLLMGLAIGLAASTVALLYYRNEMHSLGIKVGEFLSLMRDSKRQIAFNPLTRSLLFGAAMALIAGAAQGVSGSPSGKR